jgi:hypothetical protein
LLHTPWRLKGGWRRRVARRDRSAFPTVLGGQQG